MPVVPNYSRVRHGAARKAKVTLVLCMMALAFELSCWGVSIHHFYQVSHVSGTDFVSCGIACGEHGFRLIKYDAGGLPQGWSFRSVSHFIPPVTRSWPVSTDLETGNKRFIGFAFGRYRLTRPYILGMSGVQLDFPCWIVVIILIMIASMCLRRLVKNARR